MLVTGPEQGTNVPSVAVMVAVPSVSPDALAVTVMVPAGRLNYGVGQPAAGGARVATERVCVLFELSTL